MSLARMCMRICAVQSLLGRTLAGAHVYDSAIVPIDQLDEGERLPIVTVATDEYNGQITGRDLTQADQRVELVLEIGVWSKVSIPGEDSDEMVQAYINPETDAGLEMQIDIIEHQMRALLMRDDGGWSRAFKRFVTRFLEVESSRGASADRAQKFAARQIVLRCDVIGEPELGQPISETSNPVYAEVLALMEGNDEFVGTGEILRNIIQNAPVAATVLPWETIGLTKDEADAIGIFVTLDDDGNPVQPAQVDVVVEDDRTIDVTEENAAAQFPDPDDA